MKKQTVKASRAELIKQRLGAIARRNQRAAIVVKQAKRAQNTPKAAKHFKDHKLRVTSSSVTHSWRTPRGLLDLVEQVAGRIQLDPCADADPAHQFAEKANFTGNPQDGLLESWRGYGVCFANPMYGRGIVNWAQKAAFESKAIGASSDHIFLLVPARVDTKWFQEELLPFQFGVCCLKGRLKFSGSDPAPFPSMVVYFGPLSGRFKEVFSPHGWVTQ